MRLLWASLPLLPLAGLGVPFATAQATGDSVSATALKACAVIVAPSERLACYDQLAGREPAAAAAAPLVSAPSGASVATNVPSSPPVAPPVNAPPGASVAAQTPPAAPPLPAPTPKQSFGLYAAEHPVAPSVASTPSLTAIVLAFGMSSNGRPTVTLEGGQLWELDNSDPLLKTGESVIIKRAALGSFLLTTPTGRIHRVHRLH